MQLMLLVPWNVYMTMELYTNIWNLVCCGKVEMSSNYLVHFVLRVMSTLCIILCARTLGYVLQGSTYRHCSLWIEVITRLFRWVMTMKLKTNT